MKIEYSRRFIKQFQKLRPAERDRFEKRLLLWQVDPGHSSLHVHQLQGKFKGFYSLNVGGDLRAIYKLLGSQMVLFDLIGTHSELYGK